MTDRTTRPAKGGRTRPAASPRQQLGRQLGSRFSTAVVLFHSAIAERLGLNVTDFKCAEILMRIGPTHPGRLAEMTGMSSAAIAQVVGRLERAGLVKREPDTADRRRTVIRVVENSAVQRELLRTFTGFAERVEQIMDRYDDSQLEAIDDFVARVTEVLEGEAATLRRTAH
ncbi:MarR family transcriptional regulator [Dactylosporangium sp. NBC_01737]|uniref:MarR family winged helix-turn-helix transcriptional regulator n=1 Tax=Dactylosporangium sp. NBC_01737 TaxID=2975959 RepID=UPI002E104E02|nr:MarR family transcriptional regulator [Dactylosporangium sp. NBC_01737]